MRNLVPVKNFACVVICLIGLSSCPDEVSGVKHLVIENNTDNRIYFWYSGEFTSHHYPDTLLPEKIPIDITGLAGMGGMTGTMAGQRPTWDVIFSQLPDSLFSVYFFETRPESQEEWDTFRNNYELIYRKDVSLVELRSNDYTITYP